MGASDSTKIDCSSVTKTRICDRPRNIVYGIEEKPPLFFSILNAIQIVICQTASVVLTPLSLCPLLCLLPSDPMRVYLVSTALLASGVLTTLQSTLGVRLPLVVSVSPVLSAALMSLLQSPAVAPPCPGGGDLYAMGPALRTVEWQVRLRHVQGALLLAGAVQTVVGLTGLQSYLCRVLSPGAVASALILSGLTGINSAELSVYSSRSCLFILAVFMVFFAMGLRKVSLPLPTFSLQSGLTAKRFHLFRMFPVLWTSAAFFLVYKLSSVLMTYPNTDIIGFQEAIDSSKWFFFPFPFEWGPPSISVGSLIHILPAVLLQSFASMVLMHGDAHVCGVGMPPRSAVSRGLTVEGFGLLFGSLWGHGMAADSTNIGLMSFTGIASRSSVQLAAVMMICISHFSGLLRIIVSIPTQFFVAVHLFLQVGMVLTGISILRFVNWKTSRDSLIVALSIVFGLLIPKWQGEGADLHTGYGYIDNVVTQCLASSVFVAMFIGCLLDLCLPGRANHSGNHSWRHRDPSDKSTYKLPTWEELLCNVLEQLPFFHSE